MEFHEKLRELRKRKGLTQEQLAAQLYVSRTAVSKWESGRGYPGVDSLKELSKYFAVSIDDLLSGDELLTAAQADRQKFRDLVFGLLDCAVATFFFLPVFGQKSGDVIEAASLLTLTGKASYVKAVYLVIVGAVAICGALTLAFRNREAPDKRRLSLSLSLAATLVFIVSSQPYAATLTLTFLVIKALTLSKGA